MVFTSVAAAILAAVEGGILPPGPEVKIGSAFPNHTPIPPGRMARLYVRQDAQASCRYTKQIPGESTDGTGWSPVLPANHFSNRLQAKRTSTYAFSIRYSFVIGHS